MCGDCVSVSVCVVTVMTVCAVCECVVSVCGECVVCVHVVTVCMECVVSVCMCVSLGVEREACL